MTTKWSRLIKFFFIFNIVCLIYSDQALSQTETITWKISDWAPIYIIDGPYKDKGGGDGTIDFISKRLPEYHHKKRIMTTKRYNHEASNGLKVCMVTALPLKGRNLSIPSGVILAHQVILRKDKIHLLDSTDSISLEHLLQDPQFSAGITDSRYPKVLSAIIDRYKDSPGVYNYPKYRNIIKMLFAGRFDFILEYPAVIKYYEQLNKKEGVVIIIPITEIQNQHPYFPYCVACPYTEWGNMILKKINKILKKGRNTKEYRDNLLYWYDEKSRVLMNKYMDIVFKE